MSIDIEQVVLAVDAWRGRTVEIEPLAGGLTNVNFGVTVDGERMFVRIPGRETSVLAVDRANELYNTRAAAESSAAPSARSRAGSAPTGSNRTRRPATRG